MNRAELKAISRSQISGKIGVLFGINLIIFCITVLVEALGEKSLVFSLFASIVIAPAFSLSTAKVYLTVTDNIKPNAGDAFSGFEDFWAAFKVTFLMGIYIFLWSLLFVIPGIVKAYSYSMSLYVLAENKGKSARECIRESMMMTEGYKMELFFLDLSFFGWAMLAVLTFGLAGIWVVPYVNATKANSYRFLKAKQEFIQGASI